MCNKKIFHTPIYVESDNMWRSKVYSQEFWCILSESYYVLFSTWVIQKWRSCMQKNCFKVTEYDESYTVFFCRYDKSYTVFFCRLMLTWTNGFLLKVRCSGWNSVALQPFCNALSMSVDWHAWLVFYIAVLSINFFPWILSVVSTDLKRIQTAHRLFWDFGADKSSSNFHNQLVRLQSSSLSPSSSPWSPARWLKWYSILVLHFYMMANILCRWSNILLRSHGNKGLCHCFRSHWFRWQHALLHAAFEQLWY